MLNLKNKKIFFIGAHPDDIEIGCGGLISRIKNKCDISCITLSHKPTFKGHPENKKLLGAHLKALNFLGIADKKITIRNFPTLDFPSVRQQICEYLFDEIKPLKPDIIFTHSVDLNQDHEVVSKEAFRIFKDITLINFDIPISSYKFNPNLFVEISKQDVQNRLKALSYYNIYKNKQYFSPIFIKSYLIKNGLLIKKPYIEIYKIVRLPYFIN